MVNFHVFLQTKLQAPEKIQMLLLKNIIYSTNIDCFDFVTFCLSLPIVRKQ